MSETLVERVPHLNILHTFAWLPLILLAIEGLRSARQRTWIAIGGVAVGSAFLAGHPQPHRERQGEERQGDPHHEHREQRDQQREARLGRRGRPARAPHHEVPSPAPRGVRMRLSSTTSSGGAQSPGTSISGLRRVRLRR